MSRAQHAFERKNLSKSNDVPKEVIQLDNVSIIENRFGKDIWVSKSNIIHLSNDDCIFVSSIDGLIYYMRPPGNEKNISIEQTIKLIKFRNFQ